MSRNAQVSVAIAAVLLGQAAEAIDTNATSDFPSAGSTPAAQVITIQDDQATEAFLPREERVRVMVTMGIKSLTGKATVAQAWRSLVRTQDIVGIKVFSAPGPNNGTRPAVVAAIVQELLEAGLPPRHIIVWDKQLTDLRLAGFFDLEDRFGIRVESSVQAGFDPGYNELSKPYDKPLLGNLVWGDLEFGQKGPGIGRKSFLSKIVTTEITRIINVTPMLNHNVAGVSGNLYSLALGSVDNTLRFESDPEELARAVPEIYAKPALGDRVVLNVVDALICQYEGGEHGLLHYSTTLNQLRFGKDPVALDSLSVRDLARARVAAGAPTTKPNLELYSFAALLELGTNDLKRIQNSTNNVP